MRPIRPRKNKSSMKRAMQTRKSEKAAENLFKAWTALEQGKLKTGLSLYLHAVRTYGAKFKAVETELKAAKRRGILPAGFAVPKNPAQLEKTAETSPKIKDK